MWNAIDGEPDSEKHLAIFKDYEARLAQPDNRLDDLRVRELSDYAVKHGLKFDWFAVNAPREPPGSIEWRSRSLARDHLARVVREERWRKAQRITNMIIPVLSLLIALTALLTTQTCNRVIQISIPVQP